MSGYTKLFGSIVGSTIWDEDDQTRIVWITMLAMSNMHGEVEVSVPGLAKFANVSLEATENALVKLLAPDPYSRSKEFDGRRIEAIDGGWLILNHAKYREKDSEEDQREQARIRQQRHRSRNGAAPVTVGHITSRPVTPRHTKSRLSRHTEAEANTEADAEAGVRTDVSGEPDGAVLLPHRVVLRYLNEKAGKNFRESKTTLRPIIARLKEQDVDIAGIKTMIDRQVAMWRGSHMEEYLRPSTLFGETKFNEYYAAKDLSLPPARSGNNIGTGRRNMLPEEKNKHLAEKREQYDRLMGVGATANMSDEEVDALF